MRGSKRACKSERDARWGRKPGLHFKAVQIDSSTSVIGARTTPALLGMSPYRAVSAGRSRCGQQAARSIVLVFGFCGTTTSGLFLEAGRYSIGPFDVVSELDVRVDEPPASGHVAAGEISRSVDAVKALL